MLAHLRSELDARRVDHNYQDCENSQDNMNLFKEMLVKESNKYDDTDYDYHYTKLDRLEIFAVQVSFAPITDEFWGAFVDCSAQKIVIWRKKSILTSRK